jgi:hydroxymethylbilane synthase
MKTLRLGARKSALAQAQAKWVVEQLHKTFPELQVELVFITTSGDRLTATPHPHPLPLEKGEGANLLSPRPPQGGEGLGEGGLKALFTKEIEEALLADRIDLAVHSLKDMAAELPKGLVIGAVPEREDPRDVWISKKNLPFKQMTAGAKIGTGAVRRQAQIKRLLPHAQVVAVRGNVDTRLKKLAEGEWDGILLAMAGLRRLGRAEAATEILEADFMVPAVGQGCLGIQVREKDQYIRPFLKALDHAASHAAALCERAFLKELGGSCQTPIAGHASITSGELTLKGLVISPDGQHLVSAKENGRPFDAQGIGERLAQKLLAAGADKILKGVIPE